jgi:hypothetical protein
MERAPCSIYLQLRNQRGCVSDSNRHAGKFGGGVDGSMMMMQMNTVEDYQSLKDIIN